MRCMVYRAGYRCLREGHGYAVGCIFASDAWLVNLLRNIAVAGALTRAHFLGEGFIRRAVHPDADCPAWRPNAAGLEAP